MNEKLKECKPLMFKEENNFPMFRGKGNRHFLSFANPVNSCRLQAYEDVCEAQLFLSTAVKVLNSNNEEERRPLFGIKKLTDLNQIVYVNCVYGELEIIFEEEESKSLILFKVGQFSNVKNINDQNAKIVEIPLPRIPIFEENRVGCTRRLTREDLAFVNFKSDSNTRVYFIQLRNGTLFDRGTNSFNELGIGKRCTFVEEWVKVDFLPKGEYITRIITNSHSSVFATQTGKCYICGKEAYFLRNRMADFDDVQLDIIEEDELYSPFICLIEIPNEIIISIQQLFVGMFIITKSGNIYSTFTSNINPDLLKRTESHNIIVHNLIFKGNDRTNDLDTIQQQIFQLHFPFPISEIRSIDNSILVLRKEDQRLFLSKKSKFIDLEISNVRRIFHSTLEFFIVSNSNQIYSLCPSDPVPKLKAIQIPRELKPVSAVRSSKFRKFNSSQSSSSEQPQGPVYNLWESSSSLQIRNILGMTTTFFVIVTEEFKDEITNHFNYPMLHNTFTSDMTILTD